MAMDPSLLLDSLYCVEERFDEEDGDQVTESENGKIPFLQHDFYWEDEEIQNLVSKEQNFETIESNPSLLFSRTEAVSWIHKVISHYGFSVLTAILAINYLDRFLSSVHFKRDNPWMIQLVAVTCISLAAKVEETHVPLLVDLQVENSRYMFEAKTIQRMELLLLSTLDWKMHPVTPLSFLDHIVRRLGLKSNLHWDFLRRCESLILCLISDSKFASFLPSVLATATMMHVIEQIEPRNSLDYQSQLMGIIKTSKGKVNECYKLIPTISKNNHHKRKLEQVPSSPSGVISCNSSPSLAPENVRKKSRVERMSLPFVKSVFVDIVGSPRSSVSSQ